MDIKIIPYNPKDRKAVLQMLDETTVFHLAIANPSILKKSSRKFLSGYLDKMLTEVDSGYGKLLLAFSGSKSIGFVYGVKSKFYEERKEFAKIVGNVKELYVKSEYRNKGVGKLLMEEIEKYLISLGCELILLDEVHVQNERAMKFYHKLGYRTRTIELAKVV